MGELTKGRTEVPATWEEYDLAVLASADDEGRVTAPMTVPYFNGMSRLIGMQIKGLLSRPGGYNHAGPWFITPAGRAVLEQKP